MSGYNTVLKIRRLEKELDELGLQMGNSKHGNYRQEFGDIVALFPKDINSLPIYSRDAELFVGTIEDLEIWLKGVNWARQYDQMLGVSDKKKRDRKEQDERNRQLVQVLKNEKIVSKG